MLSRQRLIIVVLGLLGCAAAGAAVACSPGSDEGKADKKPRRGERSLGFPVEVAPVEVRQVEYTILAVGSVEAYEQVQVTARVAGAVDHVAFTEGDTVAKGAPLAAIDADRYRIAVDAARAALEKAEAAEPDAKASLARREALNAKAPGTISDEELQSFRTRVAVARAEIASARAALELAQVNLRDAYVRAPVAGAIQTRTVQTGQYVQPGTVLATMLRRDPLLLKFDVPEQEAGRLSTGMTAVFKVPGSQEEHRALITHVAGAAAPSSRMVSVVARVEKGDHPALRPGSFAEVRVRTGLGGEAPAIPQTAIRPSEQGFLAFVVEGDLARQRVLTLGMRTEDGRVEVRHGLARGESLVIRGAEALKDGARVRIDAGAARTRAPAPALAGESAVPAMTRDDPPEPAAGAPAAGAGGKAVPAGASPAAGKAAP